jgi:hypothetical protein
MRGKKALGQVLSQHFAFLCQTVADVPGGLSLPHPKKERRKKQLHAEILKAVPVTGRGGLQGCETLRIPHCLDNRLTDCGKFSHTQRPRSTPQQHYSSASGTHFSTHFMAA